MAYPLNFFRAQVLLSVTVYTADTAQGLGPGRIKIPMVFTKTKRVIRWLLARNIVTNGVPY